MDTKSKIRILKSIGRWALWIVFFWILIIFIVPKDKLFNNSIEYPKTQFDSIFDKMLYSNNLLHISDFRVNYFDSLFSFTDTTLYVYGIPHRKYFNQFTGYRAEYKFKILLFNKRIYVNSLKLINGKFYKEFPIFHRNAYFEYNNIDGPIKDAFIANLQFDDTAVFKNNKFINSIYCWGCIFKNYLLFFEEDTIHGALSFNDCFFKTLTFKDNESKLSQVFKGNVIFNNCKFISKLDFSNCVFSDGNLNFTNSVFPDSLDLSNIDLVKNLDLTKVKIDSNKQFCFINILNTDLNKIKMEYTKFRLYFPFNSTRDEVSATFESLMKSMKEKGYDESYQLVDCDFHQYMVRREDNKFDSTFLFRAFNKVFLHRFPNKINVLFNRVRPGAFADTLNRNWWNYGYSKGLVFRNSAILFLIFGLINIFLFSKLIYEVYPIDNISRIYSTYENNGIVFYLKRGLLSLVYTFIVFFGIKITLEKINFKKLGYVIYIMVVYTIGLVCNAFMLAYVLNR